MAEEIGGASMTLDVRDPEQHRAAARAAAEHGPLEVWVNNAGVMRAGYAWEHSDDDVRLTCDVDLLGVIWGSLAAVDAMRAGSGDRHIVNMASLAALGPVPGLSMYAAAKHGVLGFTGSLQGDLFDAGIPITVHALCPDAADTPLLREHDHEPAAAINWSGPRLLTRGRGGGAHRRAARLEEARARGPGLARVGCASDVDGGPPGAARRAGPPQTGRPPPGSVQVTMSVTEAPAATATTIDVENPATGKVIASVPVVPPDEVAALAARARRAQPGWEALGFDGRAAR